MAIKDKKIAELKYNIKTYAKATQIKRKDLTFTFNLLIRKIKKLNVIFQIGNIK